MYMSSMYVHGLIFVIIFNNLIFCMYMCVYLNLMPRGLEGGGTQDFK